MQPVYYHPFALVALTQVHVGIGRSPGTVDLPIARDSFGLPYIPGSAIKGSMKSACLRSYYRECVEECKTKRDKEKEKCLLENCKCYQLYGWDLRLLEGESPVVPFLSPVSVTDASLVLFPAYNDLGEYAYVTSRLALRRLEDLLNLKLDGIKFELQPIDNPPTYFNDIAINKNKVKVVESDKFAKLKGEGSKLSELLLEKKIYVLSDEDFLNVVEAGIIRQTRVRLDFLRKSVVSGALWSEEYLPEGAVFFFLGIYHPLNLALTDYADFRARVPTILQETHGVFKCHLDELERMDFVLEIGGKETIGKGLVKVIPWT